jgi:hypothetical protein
MAYGFDPSIILQHKQYTGPDANETMRTLAQLAGSRIQQQGVMQEQQREATLADIYKAHAGNQGALPSALMAGGFGKQAAEWQGAQSEAAGRAAQAAHLLSQQDIEDMGAIGNLWQAVDTPEAHAVALGRLPERLRGQVPAEWTPVLGQVLKGMGRQKTARPLTPEELDAKAAHAERERAIAESLRRGPPAPDAAKAENLRLRNGKLKREAGEGGPNRLLALDGYDLDPAFEVTPGVAERLREAQGQTRTMVKNVDDLTALYQRYGNKVLPGAARARMEAIARHLQLKSKGKTMFELGVIAGPDMDLLNSVVPVPTGKQATIADFFSGGGDTSETMERLRVMREQLGDNLHNSISTRGYRKKGTKSAAAGRRATDADGRVWEEQPDGTARLVE